MEHLVFVLILLTAPNGEILAHIEGLAPSVEECRRVTEKTLHDTPPPKGTSAHKFCINMKPLPTDASHPFQPKPAVTL